MTAVLPILIALAYLTSDYWVYSDAKARSEMGRPVVLSIGRLELNTPAVWAMAILLLWIVFFPLYLISSGQG